MRTAIRVALDTATDEDVVVLSFAGHGTPDHRLVAHNTTRSALTSTTIAMSDLAEWFRCSRASAILFVLDCCFSGEAPARVLEDGAVPRDPTDPFAGFAGQGRFLIAAANAKQSAYELPGTGHGILTKACIDALTAGEGQIEVTACMSEVMQRVSAEAGRIGVEQTPVMIGHVEGGLRFPVLKRGQRFAAAFPDASGIKIDGWIEQLGAFGIGGGIIDAWRTRYPDGSTACSWRP
jgi:helicase